MHSAQRVYYRDDVAPQFGKGRPSSITYQIVGQPMTESYDYTQAGMPSWKRVQWQAADLRVSFQYDNEGRRTRIQYPDSYTPDESWQTDE